MENAVLKLKEDAFLPNSIRFTKGQELEVVENVVYCGGFPLPFSIQPTVLAWIHQNPNLFINDTRRWK